MKWRTLAVLLLLLFMLPLQVYAQASDTALVIAADQVYEGNVSSATQSIRVEGVVLGDVTSWTGDIEILGRVEGDVVSYSGDVILRDGAIVQGHIMALGDGMQVAATAQVNGQTLDGGEGSLVLANLFDALNPSSPSSQGNVVGQILVGIVLAIVLIACCALCAAFWPHRLDATSQMLKRLPARSFGFGLLTSLIIGLALPPVIAVLAASLIGVPFLIALFVIVQLPFLFGLTAMARALGWFSERGFTVMTRQHVVWLVGLAFLVSVTIVVQPLWGMLLFYLIASPGVGALFLSRGGTLMLAH
jgi:hypothetical protein